MIEILVFIAFVLCLGLLWRRNDSVHKYRMALLKMVSAAAQQDIETGKDWEWRHDEFDSVSYYEMFWKFWRSFDSFYIESPAREARFTTEEAQFEEGKRYPSCMCGQVACDCPCVSGGLNKDGDVVPNKCFDHICFPHGERCI